MPKKKGFTSGKYQEEILKTLKNEPFMSTSEICHKLNIGYETGLKYINKLLNKRKVRLKKTGNRRFWYL
jgi:predicted transcriptional regulator